MSTEVLIHNHMQRKLSPTQAMHGLKLGVAQTAGQDAQALIANPDTGNNQTIASGNLTLTSGTFIGNHSGDGSLLTALNATQLTTGTVPLARISGLTNTQIAAAAGIAYSKLALTGSILNADLAGSIADSKLLTISTAGKVANSATTATATNAVSTIVLRDASGNFSCNQITVAADPTSALQVATKQYVDNLIFGLDLKESVKARTTANLTATRTGNVLTATTNIVLPTQDGVSLSVGDRLLVMNQTQPIDNGIYEVTSLGAAGTAPYVLTRAADFNDSPADEVTTGAYTYIEQGTTYASTQWALSTTGTIAINSTALTFTQISGAGSTIAGAGMTQSGNVLNVVAGDSTITVGADDIRVGANSLTDSHINTAAAIGWTKISKTGSSLADLATRSAGDLDSGTLLDARLSTNVPLKNVQNTFTDRQIVTGLTLSGTTGIPAAGGTSAHLVGGSGGSNLGRIIIGDGSGWDFTMVTRTGSVDTVRHTWSNGNYTATGTVTANLFSGSGASLTALNGSNISTGTVADARLSVNVAFLNANNTFTHTSGNIFGGTGVATPISVVRDIGAGDSTNVVQLTVGNSGASEGNVRLQYTNALATGAPTATLSFQPRNNADTASINPANIIFAKTAGADTASVTISNAAGSLVLNATGTVTSALGVSITSGALTIASTTADAVPTNFTGLNANNCAFVDASNGYVINGSAHVIINIDSDNNGTTSVFRVQTNTTRASTGGTVLFTVDENGLATATNFAGGGGSITGINGSNISTGTVADARLSANVALLNGTTAFTTKQTFDTPATTNASINLPHGVAPTTPVNGDVWTTTAGFFYYLNGVTQQSANLSANTFTGKQTLPASTTGAASLNVPHGTAPTTPTNGDIWTTTTNLHVRINGTTQALASEAFAGNAANLTTGTLPDARLSTNVPLENGTNVFTGQNDFQGKVVIGNDNQDVVEIQSIALETDDRNETITYNADGTINVITEKDGVTTVRTTTFAYNGSGNVTTKTVVAGGKTITTTYTYTGTEITGTSKTVV